MINHQPPTRWSSHYQPLLSHYQPLLNHYQPLFSEGFVSTTNQMIIPLLSHYLTTINMFGKSYPPNFLPVDSDLPHRWRTWRSSWRIRTPTPRPTPWQLPLPRVVEVKPRRRRRRPVTKKGIQWGCVGNTMRNTRTYIYIYTHNIHMWLMIHGSQWLIVIDNG